MLAPLVFHCTPLACVNHQLSSHEPAGEGAVRGVVYQNGIGYTGPKTFQYNVSPDDAAPHWCLITSASLNQHFPNETSVTDIDFKNRSEAAITTVGAESCSVHGWSLNIAWTLYVWQMLPMLNACNVQNKLWEFLSQVTHTRYVYVFS
jgi:hypothetical protein